MESSGDGEFVSLGVQEMGRSGKGQFVSLRVREPGSS